MDIRELLEHISKWSNVPDLEILSDTCDVDEIGDGNLNDVWRVRSKTDAFKSVIVKHSPPYIKCIGPDSPLTVYRINIEYRALTRFHEIKCGCVPKPFVFDAKHNLVIMEDLHDHVIMRKALVAGEFDFDAVGDIARSAAILHQETHRKCLSDEQFGELVSSFNNADMVALTYDFVFTNPFLRNHPTNRCSKEVEAHLSRVHNDNVVQDNALKMRDKFIEMKQCLLHGDLHTGSVMVREGSAKMMDLEFACMGPAAFDIGMLLANYVFSYQSHKLYPLVKGSKFYKKLRDATETTVSIYLNVLEEYMTPEEVQTTVSDIAGFAGCELIRRILGIAHVEDLEGHPLAEVVCLDIGVKLMKTYQAITDARQLLECIFQQ